MRLKEDDIENLIGNLEVEISDLRKMIVARQVLTSIPVEKCPICLSHMIIEQNDGDNCPICGKNITANDMDNILNFKRLLDESLLEGRELISRIKSESNKINDMILSVNADLEREMKKHFEGLGEKRKPIESLLSEAVAKVDKIDSEEEKYKSLLELVQLKDELRQERLGLDSMVSELREKLNELEEQLSWRDVGKIDEWKEIYRRLIDYIFGDVTSIDLDNNYMPIVDGAVIRAVSSASLKVAARLSYILSLLKLKKSKSINYLDFVIYDSPRDKDLDIDKYERFLEQLLDDGEGQVFITANINEKNLYDGKKILLELTKDYKLLREYN